MDSRPHHCCRRRFPAGRAPAASATAGRRPGQSGAGVANFPRPSAARRHGLSFVAYVVISICCPTAFPVIGQPRHLVAHAGLRRRDYARLQRAGAAGEPLEFTHPVRRASTSRRVGSLGCSGVRPSRSSSRGHPAGRRRAFMTIGMSVLGVAGSTTAIAARDHGSGVRRRNPRSRAAGGLIIATLGRMGVLFSPVGWSRSMVSRRGGGDEASFEACLANLSPLLAIGSSTSASRYWRRFGRSAWAGWCSGL